MEEKERGTGLSAAVDLIGEMAEALSCANGRIEAIAAITGPAALPK